MSEQRQRYEAHQAEPGLTNYTQWVLVDIPNKMVRGTIYSRSLAEAITAGLNGQSEGAWDDAVGLQADPEVAQQIVEEIEGSAPRDCGHQNTGDGSAVNTCGVCMSWAQAQADAMVVRKHLGLV